MSVWPLVPLAFLVGWYAHWHFKLRPFARDVEATAQKIRQIIEDGQEEQHRLVQEIQDIINDIKEKPKP